jgi:hypothetical protein
MFDRKLIKNKMYGIAFILLGIASVWACDGELSVLIFSLMFGAGLIFSKENWIYD